LIKKKTNKKLTVIIKVTFISILKLIITIVRTLHSFNLIREMAQNVFDAGYHRMISGVTSGKFRDTFSVTIKPL
jgi:hypothetical protein